MAGSLLYFALLSDIQSDDSDSLIIIENDFWNVCFILQKLL